MVFNTGPYTVLPDNSILITANMQSKTGFPSSHQLKSYVASKSRLKLAARAVLSADAGLLVLSGRQCIGAHALCMQRSPTAAALSTSFLLNHAPQQPELNALITRFTESYSSVSISRESKRLKKSRSDWLNSGNALIQI